jgi:hypothetical protein
MAVQPASLEVLEKAAVPPVLGIAYFFVTHLQH